VSSKASSPASFFGAVTDKSLRAVIRPIAAESGL
jgi:hypothetical protein